MEDLLILYCPGSRGDFLAAILLDQIKNVYDDYKISKPGHYHKMHGIGKGINPWDDTLDETSILKNRSRSIRIKLAPADYAFIEHLVANKNLPSDMNEITISNWEKQYRKLDIKFGHIVWFSDLFNVEFLQDFYQRFNGRAMPEEYVPLIKHNIDLQYKIASYCVV